MAHSQLLLGEAPLKEQVELEHDLGHIFLAVDLLQSFDPLFPGIAQELVDVRLAIPPSVFTPSDDFLPTNTFDMPPANLLNDQLSLQLSGFKTHGSWVNVLLIF